MKVYTLRCAHCGDGRAYTSWQKASEVLHGEVAAGATIVVSCQEVDDDRPEWWDAPARDLPAEPAVRKVARAPRQSGGEA